MIDAPALAALLGFAGLVVGSFVNLVAARLPAGRPIAWARSQADCCGATLSPLELVPVVSWLVQRVRCRRCGAAVSARHPAVELAGAGLGVWAAFASGSVAEALLTAALGWQLLLIALVDVDELWLPDRLTAPLAISGLAAAAILPEPRLIDAVAGAVTGFAVLWLVSRLYSRARGRQGLGGGDPFLFGAIGAWVGWMGLPSVLLWACVGGLSWVGARWIARRPVGAQEALPFGPFLALGGWLTWVFGPIGIG